MKPVALVVPARWVDALIDENKDMYDYSIEAEDFVAFIEFAQDHLHLGFFTVDENSVPYFCELHDATEYNVPGCEVIDTIFTSYY
jgi:hypothetical protein